MINDLTQGSVSKQLIRFAFPLVCSNFLQTLYGIIDMVIIGQYVGAEGLSGVSIGSDLLMFVTFICMGMTSAGQVMISQFVGAGDRNSLKSTIGTLFSFIALLAVGMTILCVSLTDWLLRIMSTPPEAFTHAHNYTVVCFSGIIFIYGYNTVSAILRGMGDSTRPFIFIAIAAVLNIIFDMLFVVGLGMETAGAALATVLGQGVSFVTSIIYLYIKREAFSFDFKLGSFKMESVKVKQILRLGFPMALQHSAISLSTMFVNSHINAYGVVISAVNGVGSKLRSIMNVISVSFSTAATSMNGQNLGAGRQDRIPRIVHTHLGINVAAATLFSVIFILFPEGMFSIFNSDPEVLAWARSYIGVAVLAYFSMALMSPYNAVINGIGYASLSLVIGLLDGVIARVGLSLLLGDVLGWGVQGYWYGNVLAGFVTVILAAIYFYSGRWKKRKIIINT